MLFLTKNMHRSIHACIITIYVLLKNPLKLCYFFTDMTSLKINSLLRKHYSYNSQFQNFGNCVKVAYFIKIKLGTKKNNIKPVTK